MIRSEDDTKNDTGGIRHFVEWNQQQRVCRGDSTSGFSTLSCSAEIVAAMVEQVTNFQDSFH